MRYEENQKGIRLNFAIFWWVKKIRGVVSNDILMLEILTLLNK